MENRENRENCSLEVISAQLGSVIDTREPRGLFYSYDVATSLWIGVDNRTGDAWTEEFKTKQECIEWLPGDCAKGE